MDENQWEFKEVSAVPKRVDLHSNSMQRPAMNEVYVLQRFDKKRGHWRFLSAVATEAEAKSFLLRPHRHHMDSYRYQRFIPVQAEYGASKERRDRNERFI